MQSAEDCASSRQQNTEKNAVYSLALLQSLHRTASLLSKHSVPRTTEKLPSVLARQKKEEGLAFKLDLT